MPDNGIVHDTGGMRLRGPRSAAQETIFWEGQKDKSPRSVTLWLEPVITITCMARLALDYGWPKELLGMQSKGWGFDVVAYAPGEGDRVHIAGEVKKTDAELEELLGNMLRFSEAPE